MDFSKNIKCFYFYFILTVFSQEETESQESDSEESDDPRQNQQSLDQLHPTNCSFGSNREQPTRLACSFRFSFSFRRTFPRFSRMPRTTVFIG